MKVGVFTIIAKNYLAFARVLMGSVRRHDPDMARIVVLVDEVEGYFDPGCEDFDVIRSSQFDIPNSRWFHFKYSVLELSTAVKPWAIEYILREYSLDQLIYLDPDIRTYDSLGSITEQLIRQSGNLLLTPHLTESLDLEHHPTDLDILRSGAYNLGFIAVARSPETTRFVKWWQEKLYDLCVVDVPRGLFVDQRWIDLVPSLFAGVLIDRSPRYNIAYWNIGHRRIERSGGRWLVKGEPLCFFHFSGFSADDPEEFSRHQNRFRTADLGEAAQLVRDYARELIAAGFRECQKWPYSHSRFSNGVRIPDLGRPVQHEHPELLERIADPFSDEGFNAFAEVWNEPVSGPRFPLPRLAYRIYRTRSDVQAVMPDVFGGDLLRFLHWMVTSGQREHALDDAFLRPVREAIDAAGTAGRDATPEGSDGFHAPESLVQLELRRDGLDPNEFVNGGTVKLTRLAQAIYDRRPDLQRMFPNPHGQDAARFLLWFFTYGAKEYRLAPRYIEPLGQQWAQVLGALGSTRMRMWYSALLRAARLWVGLNGPAGRMRSLLTKTGKRPKGPARQPPRVPRVATPLEGVNVIGYLRAEMGVGESARRAVQALRTAGLHVATRNVSSAAYREQDTSFSTDAERLEHAVSLFYINADQTHVAAQICAELPHESRRIGFWAWELESFPGIWASAFEAYDEIWTASSFAASAVAQVSPIPVVSMGYAVEVKAPPACGRGEWGMRSDEFVFLAAFDARSVVERKNPAAAIDAFRLAFPAGDGPRLIMKVNNGHAEPERMRQLRERASGLKVTFIEQTISRSEMNGLLASSDCFVSLHRSEGFGLQLAEAMFLGKPVVATAYSGNMEFTKPDNSFLVPYRMCPVGNGCAPYDPASQWADPAIDIAAQYMKLIVEQGELRRERARAGQKFVHAHLSPTAVGARMRRRLEVVTGSARIDDDVAAATAAH